MDDACRFGRLVDDDDLDAKTGTRNPDAETGTRNPDVGTETGTRNPTGTETGTGTVAAETDSEAGPSRSGVEAGFE